MAQGRLDQRLGQPAVGEVVGAGEQARPAGVGEQRGEGPLGRQVDPRRQPAEVAVDDVGPLRARQLLAGLAEQDDPVTFAAEAGRAYGG